MTLTKMEIKIPILKKKIDLRTLLILGLIVVAFFAFRKWGTGYYNYKNENKALRDTITQMDREYSRLEESAAAQAELTEAAISWGEAYKDSFDLSRTVIRTNNIRHEREVAALRRIPTDTLYGDVRARLRELSSEWEGN